MEVSRWLELLIVFPNISRAPTDCVQYFTGVSGTVQSYNFGNQILQSQNYRKPGRNTFFVSLLPS